MVGGVGDESEAGIDFIGTFETRGEVDGIADHGIIHAMFRAHISNNRFTRINTDTCFEEWFIFLFPLFSELEERFLHFDRSKASASGVIFLDERSPPEANNGIAFKFINDPIVFGNDIPHISEVFIEDLN